MENKWKTRGVQESLMNLLIRLKRVLDANGIEFLLIGGSAIGALRSKGFIPWDDDIDISIKEEDYLKFKSIDWSGSGITLTSDKDSQVPFDKVFDNTMKMKWRGREDFLFIDVFTDFKERKMGRVSYFRLIALDYILHIRSYSWRGILDDYNIFFTFVKATLSFFPLTNAGIKKKYRKIITNKKVISNRRFQYFAEDLTKEYRGKIYHDITKPESVIFQGENMKVPKNFKDTRKLLYGDISKPPKKLPEKSDHGIEMLNK